MKKIWLAALVLLCLDGAGSAQPEPSPPEQLTGDARTQALSIQPDDRILGDANAPITILEYASLTCPHCAHFTTEVLPKLKEAWIDTGKAKLVLRDYPLDGIALHAAVIARCAPPDKFYGFIDTFFQTQQKWATAKDPVGELQRLAKVGGMSDKTVKDCLDDKAGQDHVVQSELTAQRLGVDSTPTFFINGTKYEGAPEEDALGAALSKAAGS